MNSQMEALYRKMQGLCCQIHKLENTGVVMAAGIANFPVTGDPETIYVDTVTGLAYFWDPNTNTYKPIGAGGAAAAAWGSITGTLSNQLDLQAALNLKANLAGPAFTGNPTATTQFFTDNSTRLATTAFVRTVAPQHSSANSFTGNYTLTANDDNDIVSNFPTDAVPATITIPTGLRVGFSCQIWQRGTGEISFVAAGGVTLLNRQGFTKLFGQNSGATLSSVGTDIFMIQGDLKA